MPTYVVSGSDAAATAYAKAHGGQAPVTRVTAVKQITDRTGRLLFADDWRAALGDSDGGHERAAAFLGELWKLPEAQAGTLAVEVRL